jgi:multiple sugar transport system permease protein
LRQFFGVTIQFLEDARWAFPAVLAVDVWMWSPFMALMRLAGLQAVPQHLLEAAEIDQLSWFRKLRYVVLPSIRPVFMLGILLRTIDAFKTFDTVFVMTGGGPGNSTELLSMSLYRMAFIFFNTGKASSLAISMLFIAIAFTSIYLMLIPKPERE